MDQLEQLPSAQVQATWMVECQKKLFALLLLFVKAIPELLIA